MKSQVARKRFYVDGNPQGEDLIRALSKLQIKAARWTYFKALKMGLTNRNEVKEVLNMPEFKTWWEDLKDGLELVGYTKKTFIKYNQFAFSRHVSIFWRGDGFEAILSKLPFRTRPATPEDLVEA